MKLTFSYAWALVTLLACGGKNPIESQSVSPPTARILNEHCQDCELMFINIPDKILSVDTTDGWSEDGQKLIVSGKVFGPDKSTYASDVVIYYYHTDQKGYYSPGTYTDAGAHKHGRLRGWVKTGKDGSYKIYTSRPAQYPDHKIEAHIHVLIKEPDLDKPYWIDEWVFDDDPLLTSELRNRFQKRGGSGILEIKTDGNIQYANHDVILGLNIPGYPK